MCAGLARNLAELFRGIAQEVPQASDRPQWDDVVSALFLTSMTFSLQDTEELFEEFASLVFLNAPKVGLVRA